LFFYLALRTERPGDDDSYWIIVDDNADNTSYTFWIPHANGEVTEAKGATVATSADGTAITTEFAMPWEGLPLKRPARGQTAGMQITRTRKTADQETYSEWSPSYGGALSTPPQFFWRVVFE
jgi:hypothetical protein